MFIGVGIASQLLRSSEPPWFCFSFHKDPYVFRGDRSGLQVGQFSTRTLLLLSHAVVMDGSLDDVMYCRWWEIQSLLNLMVKNIFYSCSRSFRQVTADWWTPACLDALYIQLCVLCSIVHLFAFYTASQLYIHTCSDTSWRLKGFPP